MGIKETSPTNRRKLEMMDIKNNLGKNRKCERYNEKESTEHVMEFSGSLERDNIKREWLRETKDIIRRVNDWIQREVEKIIKLQ